MYFSFDFSVFSGQYLDTGVLLCAIVVGIMTSICGSALGVSLVLKRYSMIGDGLSHVGFLALAIAALFELEPSKNIYITIPVVICAALLLMQLSNGGRLKGDSATALVSVGTVALGYIIFNIAESGSGDVCSSLFGASVLTLRATDTVLGVLLCIVVILVYCLNYNKIFAVTFDEAFAKSTGIKTNRINLLISVLTALTVVVGMKLLGSIMISAIIVIPAITSMRIFNNFRAVVVSSVIFSSVCFILGFLFAVTFTIDKDNSISSGVIMLPVGATVVCFNLVSLIITTIMRKIKQKLNTL